jgi:ADP-heptose:LPS heptosyltransferase
MPKLILQCGLSPGDIVMMTAAVRDLHRCYPNQFLTDVRTRCPAIWENNPYLVHVSEEDEEAEQIDCAYPLINRCNTTPYHCLHGFIEFLNDRLKLSIRPTDFKGDIHLTEREKTWYSQVYELADCDLPFWIIAAGGKYDITIKWWQTERYQEVVDHFRGRVQFVQVGQLGHHHPKLDGVIDLRGRTTLRELIRLVYHAQGVLCSVTALMHLAAAVPCKPGQPPNRPCVVVAGGREPAHWEAYPDHQFIHTNGALDCCSNGGCWKDRVIRLRDGDKRDRPGELCLRVQDGLPRCMDMISAAEVIRRIQMYIDGGIIKPLTAKQNTAAAVAVASAAKNDYDQQPLNIHNAGMACDEFIRRLPPYPGNYEGRGIVVCGGGPRYLTNAWVCVNMLRRLGCRLPVQLWYLGKEEKDARMEALLAELGVQCVDAFKLRRRFPVRILNGWELKAYALLHCRFREVLLLDADNVPVVNPEFLFDTPQFHDTGAIFWPDYPSPDGALKALPVWRSCGLSTPKEPEFETGQIVVDKSRCWRALRLSLWFNENSDFYYRYLHGDKETFHLAFRKLRKPYALVPEPIHPLHGTMCQHDFEGRRVFQHRNTDKWDLFLSNSQVEGFWFEKECIRYLQQLQRRWDGGMEAYLERQTLRPRSQGVKRVTIQAVMISCPEREELRHKTLANLASTDWGDMSVVVQVDGGIGPDHGTRQTDCALIALKKGWDSSADYVLFLEDDLQFNRHIRHNLFHWKPLRERSIALAGLYNPNLRESAYDLTSHARIIAPSAIFGSQALLLSREALGYVIRNWRRASGMQDIRISRLAGRLPFPVLYHFPSLVQHVGDESVWGGRYHRARDFDANWRHESSVPPPDRRSQRPVAQIRL